MVALRIFFDTERAGAALIRKNKKDVAAAKGAMRASADQAAKEIIIRGRLDMASAGNFSSARWQQGLHADVQAFDNGNVRINVSHDVPYFRVFQNGAVIHGRPLLWIPLPGTAGERGDFFQTSRKGNLLLFKKSGKEITPLRVAKESVRIPKKFHIVEIARDVSRKLGALYRANLAQQKG